MSTSSDQGRAGVEERLTASFLRLQQLAYDGRFDLARDLADELADDLAAVPDRGRLADALPIALVEIGIVLLLAGDLDAAIGRFRSAARWSRINGHPAGPYAEQFIELVRALRGGPAPAMEPAVSPAPLRGAPGQRVWAWTLLPHLLRALDQLHRGDLDGVDASLESIGFASPTTETSPLGGLWWLPLHVHARLALARGDQETMLPALRNATQDWYPQLGSDSYAGSLLRADHADLLQAAGGYEEAAAILDDGAHGVQIPQLSASRARLLWLASENGELDRFLTQIGPLHLLNSAELDVIRLVRRFETRAQQVASADDLRIWTSLRDRAGAIELSLMPDDVRSALAGPADHDIAGRRTVPNPYVRTHVVRLSPRERELVLELQAEDTIPMLAARLFLSPSTVKTHLRGIYRKAGVHSKEELFHAREDLLRRGR
ncbi:helix-turn-helix transcriptional regulator [Brachybacterium hainanense]|uniref:LuxR C-terminal-related transcriptional regulator n=1 Tax=Brachybacterium hainanense TaxID=1541174 RepID=A0ABV6RCX2_9MICO